MKNVELILFGDLQVVSGGRVLKRLPSQPCRRLLAFLGIHADRRVKKKTVEEAIWPGENPPANRLAVTLYQVRRALAPLEVGDAELIESSRTHLALNPGCVDVDWMRLQALGSRAAETQQFGDALTALNSYTAPLLEGWDEPWVADARKTTRLMAGRACTLLIRAAKTKEEINQAAKGLARAIECDPALTGGVIDSLRALEGMGGALVAEALSERIVLVASPRAAGELEVLKEKPRDDSASLYVILILDHAPSPEVQRSILLMGAIGGRSSDYCLAVRPSEAVDMALRAWREMPTSKMLLTAAVMRADDPLPAGYRAMARGIPSSGIWVDVKAARLFEGGVYTIGQEVEGGIAPLEKEPSS